MSIDDIFTSMPVLETARLMLREISSADAARMAHEFMAPEPLAQLHDGTAGMEPFSIHDPPPWGVFAKGEEGAIGFCRFHEWHLRHARACLLFALAPSHRHRGYMSEALRAVLTFGFRRMELNRIEITCSTGNIAAIRTMEQIGMKEEMVLRGCVLINGTARDLCLYSALAQEWRDR